MKKLTIYLPEMYVKGIEALVKEGFYPNTTETIRFTVKDMLEREVWIFPRNWRYSCDLCEKDNKLEPFSTQIDLITHYRQVHNI
jgi:hypothetical protein